MLPAGASWMGAEGPHPASTVNFISKNVWRFVSFKARAKLFNMLLAGWGPSAPIQLAPAGGTCVGSPLSGAYGPLQPVAVVHRTLFQIFGSTDLD